MEIVYKYRNWNLKFHRDNLIKNQLYCASPKHFNDPFDCRINENLQLLNNDEEYIEDLIKLVYPSGVDRNDASFKRELRKFKKRFQNKTESQKIIDKQLRIDQDNYYAIFSCSKDWRNIQMWSHYGNIHKGICIGYYVDKLKTIFNKDGIVIYDSKYPSIKPVVAIQENKEKLIENSFLETHVKSEYWRSENEYRFMTNFFPNKLTKENRLRIIPNDFFAEVILGINISRYNKKRVVEICKNKNIPVYQACKVPFNFLIDKGERII